MAIIDRATAVFDAGLGMTMEQLDAKLGIVRRKWKDQVE